MHNELDIVLEAVQRAGTRVMELAKNGFEVHRKPDHSPVTTADLAVNTILQETLLRHFPHDGWMSEESPDTPDRLNKSRVWIVDPIDGTSYFLKSIPQFSISVALVKEHEPILGVVYNPATQELFAAEKGKGLLVNGKPVASTAPCSKERLTILVNPSRLERQELKPYQGRANLQPMGSIAYSLALVAAGQADATVNFDCLHEWDIAAGCLLVQENRGIHTDFHGHAIRYNQAEPLVHGVLAIHEHARETFQTLTTLP